MPFFNGLCLFLADCAACRYADESHDLVNSNLCTMMTSLKLAYTAAVLVWLMARLWCACADAQRLTPETPGKRVGKRQITGYSRIPLGVWLGLKTSKDVSWRELRTDTDPSGHPPTRIMLRLCKEQVDLESPGSIEQLIDQVSATPGCSLHGALECKSWSAWSRLNAAKHPDYLQGLEEEREQSRKLLMQFIRVAAIVIHAGGEVSFEWPRHAAGWSLPEMIAFIDQFGLLEALFDGCRFGLVSHRGWPMRKPWKIVTTSRRLAGHLSQFRCVHGKEFKHDVVEGQDSRRSAFYPEAMARAMLVSLFPYASAFVAPALPCVPSLPHCHREKDKRPQLPLDLLMYESGMRELKVGGCVHRLLDRKEWVREANPVHMRQSGKKRAVCLKPAPGLKMKSFPKRKPLHGLLELRTLFTLEA